MIRVSVLRRAQPASLVAEASLEALVCRHKETLALFSVELNNGVDHRPSYTWRSHHGPRRLKWRGGGTILLSEEDETDTVEVASGRQTKQAMQSARARPFLDHLSI
jgi:hypothetical protein